MTRVPALAGRLRRLRVAAILLLAVLGVEASSAQIYEWTDEAGDSHYDSSLELIPEDRRAQARLFVPASQPAAPSEPAQSENDQDAAAADDLAAEWDAGFDAGWVAGYRAAVEEAPECPVVPEPVVLESRPPVVISVPFADPSGAYYRSPYGNMITVPFDDGASRGLTGRSQIQQQRALERGW
jgi:hypothetical protein